MTYSFPDAPESIVVHGSDNRTDNRRDKVYSRDVSIRVIFRKDQWEERGERHFSPVPLLTEAVKAALAGKRLAFTRKHAITPVDARVRVSAHDWGTDQSGAPVMGGYGLSFWITVTLVAERPSRIPTAEEAEGVIHGAGVVEAVREAANAAVAAYEVGYAAEHRTEQANHVLAQTVAQAREKARGIVRYEQRLAALRAEYAEECGVQAKAIIDSADPDEWVWAPDAEGKPRPIDPRIVRAVKARLVEEARRSGTGARFPRSATNPIKVEEVA